MLAGVAIGGILLFSNHSVLTNLYAHSFCTAGGILLLAAAIGAYRKGFAQARYFIAGWSFMLAGLGISFCRNAGWIPNNTITINITFIAVAIQSVLLSTALIQTVKMLMTEKETALRQYYEAEELAKSRELAFLHAQIKPHFLYNTLNIIVNLCRIDPEKARNLLLDLSDYLHHSFDFCPEQKVVLLEDELKCVQSFIRIERARFPNKLNVLYGLCETAGVMVPPLILQPLVENAVVHGTRRKNAPGTVFLRINEEDGGYRIEVEDNGPGMTEDEIQNALSDRWYKGKGIGIANINKRLTRFYGAGLSIQSTPGEGTVVSFRLSKGEAAHADSHAGG